VAASTLSTSEPTNRSDRVLTIEDVAEILGQRPRTIAEWARSQEIPGIKVGRKWLFFEDSIFEYLASRETGRARR
jgi:excisionase family DNA binding protein